MAKSFFSSGNPVLNDEKIQRISLASRMDGSYIPMTINGAVNKTLILTGILLITGYISYSYPNIVLFYVGLIGGLIAVLVGSFKPNTSPIAAPIYAGFEGLALGTISAMYAYTYQGIVLQAISLTIGTLITMLIIYRSGLITVNAKFRAGVMMATGAIFFVYLISFVGSFFGWNMPYLHESGAIGIGISAVIIAIAALNLLLDFDLFEKAEQSQAPQYMEWFCGMSLMVTLVWLYIEFLRLLSKLRD